MINLYRRAMQGLDPTWHDRYIDICAKVKAVRDWCNINDASDALLEQLIYDVDNGIASAGQAFSTWPTPRPNVGDYRDMLAQLKEGLNARYPADEVANCRNVFKRITHNRGTDSIFNRIVSAFQPGLVSPVMFEHDFDDVVIKLIQGGYIREIHIRPGDDPWYSENIQLMSQLRELLPDGQHEGLEPPIDDYSRGMFVWGVHVNINMDDWIVLRNHR